MTATLSLITAPTDDPVSVDEAVLHARVEDSTAEASDIELKLAAAVRNRESYVQRQLMPATWELWLHAWPTCGIIWLPKPPLQSVTWIKYIDSNGVEQTWDSAEYVVVAPAGPRAGRGYVHLAYGESFPAARSQPNAIKVRFVAGYADADAVPAEIKQAILLTFGEMYAQREEQTVGTIVATNLRAADNLCSSFRVFA